MSNEDLSAEIAHMSPIQYFTNQQLRAGADKFMFRQFYGDLFSNADANGLPPVNEIPRINFTESRISDKTVKLKMRDEWNDEVKKLIEPLVC